MTVLRALRRLEQSKVTASDGELGLVVGFLVERDHYVVRYLVVETGGFVGGSKLLVSPISLHKNRTTHRGLHVATTISKVQDAPRFDLDQPISRRMELEFHRYYGYAQYWGQSGTWGESPQPGALARARNHDSAVVADTTGSSEVRLLKATELRQYQVAGSDDVLGRVEDFVVDDETWEIRYFVVATDPWFGGQVLIAPEWARRTSPERRTIYFGLTRQAVQDSPEWNPTRPITREDEARLYAHYERPGYWALGKTAS